MKAEAAAETADATEAEAAAETATATEAETADSVRWPDMSD
ncbi:MAG: hypothetical protein SPE66_00515 [Bilifractor sp.]|nr:hypothetical protein [Bilifractor sp.]